MEKLAKKIFAIGATSSRNDKKMLLKEFGNDDNFKLVLKFIFNPYYRTGIGAKKIKNCDHDAVLNYSPSVYEIIEYFRKNNTGRDVDVIMAVSYINTVRQQYGDAAAELVEAIVTQKLTIGVTSKTMNEVYGDDFIPTVGTMLAHRYDHYKEKVKGPFIVSSKLDGERRIIVKHDGTTTIYTRTGQIDTGLIEIEKDAACLPDNTVYDGELLAKGTFNNSIAQRQATGSLARKKGIKTGLDFNVFDVVPYEDFIYDKCKNTALVRKLQLSIIFGDKDSQSVLRGYINSTGGYIKNIYFDTEGVCTENIKPVPTIAVTESEDRIMRIASDKWANGEEGVMLNVINGLYRIKRTKDILKVKHCISLDLPIVDMEEGTGKNAGRLGALIVEYKGNRVGVGTGFSDSARIELWNNKEAYIGKIVTIDTFGESVNKDGNVSLNCGVFGGIRNDK